MTVNVKTQDGEVACNYYTYLRDKQKAPWWDHLKEMVKRLFVTPQKDSYQGTEKLEVFDLTKEQNKLFMSVQGKIKCNVDKKTSVVSVEVRDQDPLVCAIMADATCQKLQEFITEYRTNKARVDYEYYQKLCDESKDEYEKALQKYVTSVDANSNTILASYQAKTESLENDMQAKYNVYTAINTQMQAARAKLQEATPAFTVIESASVPFKPAGPRRMILSVAMMILSFLALSSWLLMKDALSTPNTPQ